MTALAVLLRVLVLAAVVVLLVAQVADLRRTGTAAGGARP